MASRMSMGANMDLYLDKATYDSTDNGVVDAVSDRADLDVMLWGLI